MTQPRAALDPQEVLAHAPYVRSLARELVFDAHLAHDVSQEALLAALQHTPREQGALRPWLAVLVRNFALRAWRSGARREERERGSARAESAVSTPAEILEREELRRTLVERVLALDQPLRDALILRFFDELPPREIARRLELPVETVRSRIKRALEILRERLDREHRGDRGVWALAFVRALKVPASDAQVAGALASFVSGAVLMTLSKKVALTAVVLALLAGGLYWRAHLGSAARSEPVRSADAVLAALKDRGTGEPSKPAPEESSSETLRTAVAAAQPEAAPTEGAVLLRVSWHDGTPAAGIGARVETGGGMFEGAFEVQTGPDGTCRIDHLKPGKIYVRLDRPAAGAVEVKAGELAELPMTIPDGNNLVGIVVEADGSPVAGADVFVDQGDVLGRRVAQSGPDGRFSVRSIARQMIWVSARAPFHPPTPQVIAGGLAKDQEPLTREVRLVFLARGGALEGVLRNSAGEPVSNALVLVGREVDRMHKGDLDPIRLPDGSEAYLPGAQHVAVDEAGRFRVAGVATGKQPVWVRAPGFGQWKGEAEVREGEVARIEIVLLPGTTVEGTLRDFAGQPIQRLPIVLVGEHSFHHRSAYSAADGSYALHDLPSGEFELVVFRDRAPTTVSAHLVGSPGAVLRWDPVLGTGLAIRGRIVSRGLDLRGFMIRCTNVTAPGTSRSDSAQPDSAGRFEFLDRDDVPHRLEISSSLQPSCPLAVLEKVMPTGEELAIEIDPAQWPSARFKGRVLDSARQPLASVLIGVVRATPWPSSSGLREAAPTGAFDLGPYPPGRWKVQVWRMGTPKPLFLSDEVEVSADQTFDFGDLIVP